MRFLKLMLLASILTFSQLAVASDAWYAPKLPFEEAIVTYKVSGTMSGSKTVYVRDYGNEYAEYSDTSMKMFGMSQRQNEVVIVDKDWVYTYDLEENSGEKMTNPAKIFKEELSKYSAKEQKTIAKNAEDFSMNMVMGMKGEMKKNAATLHGYQCDMVSMMGVQIYSISGTDFPLKTVSKVMGTSSTEEASSIKKTAPPADRFVKPKGIHVSYDPRADQMMRSQIKQTLQRLLSGKSETTTSQPAAGGYPGLSPEEQQQLQQLMKSMGQ